MDFAAIFEKNYANTVTRDFKNFLDNNIYIDLIFVCHNNEKVGAHQIVMGCISKFFYKMFLENMNTGREKIVHVYVPDIRSTIMKRILEFIYCGRAMLKKGELTEFNDDIKLLGMPLDLFGSNDAQTSELQNNTNIPNNDVNLSNVVPPAAPITHQSNFTPVTARQAHTIQLNSCFNSLSDSNECVQLPVLRSVSNTPPAIEPDRIVSINQTDVYGKMVVGTVATECANLHTVIKTNSSSLSHSNTPSRTHGLPCISREQIVSPVAEPSNSVTLSSTNRSIMIPKINSMSNILKFRSNELTPDAGEIGSEERKRQKVSSSEVSTCIELDSDDDIITIS